jgi:hypothetical protein
LHARCARGLDIAHGVTDVNAASWLDTELLGR